MLSRHDGLESHLEKSYQEIGAFEADIVFIYTDLRTFGREIDCFPTRMAFLSTLLQPLLKRGQTVLVPTFTYTADGLFEVETTLSRLGALNRGVLKLEGVARSEHPIFSVAAIGPQASLVQNVGKSAFGAESVFERLHYKQAKFVHVGRPVAVGNTVVHYVEQRCGATYRYHKAFPTQVCRAGTVIGCDYTAFVRRRDVLKHDFNFTYAISPSVLHRGLGVREIGSNLDHTNVSAYSFDQAVAFLTESFYRNPSVFTGTEYLNYY